jgi:hypothetical protein
VSNGSDEHGHRATLGTLVWTVPVRLLDVSRAGCRFESPRALETGVNGQLRIPLGGRVHVDDVRVARCQVREGAGQRYLVGAELLCTRRLNTRSIRLAIGELIDEHDASEGSAPRTGNHGAGERVLGPIVKVPGPAPPGTDA